MPFLYGNHIVKAHLGRITDDTPEHTGVIIFSMSDSPLVNYKFCTYKDDTDMLKIGFRCYCKIHHGYEETSTYRYHCFPSSRCWRISS